MTLLLNLLSVRRLLVLVITSCRHTTEFVRFVLLEVLLVVFVV